MALGHTRAHAHTQTHTRSRAEAQQRAQRAGLPTPAEACDQLSPDAANISAPAAGDNLPSSSTPHTHTHTCATHTHTQRCALCCCLLLPAAACCFLLLWLVRSLDLRGTSRCCSASTTFPTSWAWATTRQRPTATPWPRSAAAAGGARPAGLHRGRRQRHADWFMGNMPSAACKAWPPIPLPSIHASTHTRQVCMNRHDSSTVLNADFFQRVQAALRQRHSGRHHAAHPPRRLRSMLP
jgi:hypothetical protein